MTTTLASLAIILAGVSVTLPLLIAVPFLTLSLVSLLTCSLNHSRRPMMRSR
jgi:hypothetical protein